MNKLTIAGLYVLFAVIIALLAQIAINNSEFAFEPNYKVKGPLSIENLEKQEAEYKERVLRKRNGEIDPERAERLEAEYMDLTDPDVHVFFKNDVPLDKPHMSTPYIMTWVALAVPDTMTFGFNDFEARLAKSSRYYTDKGWLSFSQALERSRIIEMIEANQQIITAAPKGAPVLESRGVVDGRFQWIVQLPLILTYRSGAKTYNTGLLVTVVVVRSDDPKHPYGLAIEQWLAAAR